MKKIIKFLEKKKQKLSNIIILYHIFIFLLKKSSNENKQLKAKIKELEEEILYIKNNYSELRELSRIKISKAEKEICQKIEIIEENVAKREEKIFFLEKKFLTFQEKTQKNEEINKRNFDIFEIENQNKLKIYETKNRNLNVHFCFV